MLLRHLQRGFSLIEVMVALIVLSVGLLGVVKLESVAYSSTNTAAKRSLAALEAASLAASMHVNRGYWTSPDPFGATITVANTTNVTVTAGAPLLATQVAAAQNCQSTITPCLVTDMAAYDLKQWQIALLKVLPNYTATINCGALTPLSCMINISWNENTVNVDTKETGALASPSYTLYVTP